MTDRKQRREYLTRLKAFTEKLPANFNSLKANVLFQILQLNLKVEEFDKELFLAYLKLPRRTNYVNQEYLKSIRKQSYMVKLDRDYSKFIQMPPIRNDDSVIESHLQHFLKDARDYEALRSTLMTGTSNVSLPPPKFWLAWAMLRNGPRCYRQANTKRCLSEWTLISCQAIPSSSLRMLPCRWNWN